MPSPAGKTDSAVEEAVIRDYAVTHNASKVAKMHGMPVSTVRGILNRMSGDALAKMRAAMRERLARECWETVREMARHARKQIPTMGGGEAARAAADLGKMARHIEPPDAGEAQDHELHITVHAVPGVSNVQVASTTAVTVPGTADVT